jgi:hypothetical protein
MLNIVEPPLGGVVGRFDQFSDDFQSSAFSRYQHASLVHFIPFLHKTVMTKRLSTFQARIKSSCADAWFGSFVAFVRVPSLPWMGEHRQTPLLNGRGHQGSLQRGQHLSTIPHSRNCFTALLMKLGRYRHGGSESHSSSHVGKASAGFINTGSICEAICY